MTVCAGALWGDVLHVMLPTALTDLTDRYRSEEGWMLGAGEEPLTPAAIRLLVAPLATFAVMMVVMASLFLVS
jgi:hypothetical protein